MATVFNAGSTMGSYYKAEVNHNMPQFAGQKLQSKEISEIEIRCFEENADIEFKIILQVE